MRKEILGQEYDSSVKVVMEGVYGILGLDPTATKCCWTDGWMGPTPVVARRLGLMQERRIDSPKWRMQVIESRENLGSGCSVQSTALEATLCCHP